MHRCVRYWCAMGELTSSIHTSTSLSRTSATYMARLSKVSSIPRSCFTSSTEVDDEPDAKELVVADSEVEFDAFLHQSSPLTDPNHPTYINVSFAYDDHCTTSRSKFPITAAKPSSANLEQAKHNHAPSLSVLRPPARIRPHPTLYFLCVVVNYMWCRDGILAHETKGD
jgi:hypothetical protein